MIRACSNTATAWARWRAGPVAAVTGGQSMDVGAPLSQLVTDSAHTISTLPPAALVAGIVLIFVGLMMLRRAF